MQKPFLTALLTLLFLQLPNSFANTTTELIPLPASPTPTSTPLNTTIGNITLPNALPTLKPLIKSANTSSTPLAPTIPMLVTPSKQTKLSPSVSIPSKPLASTTIPLKLKPIVTQPTTVLPPSNTIVNTMVTAFPFALTQTLPTAIEESTALAYSSEETFAYTMPSATEAPMAPTTQQPLVASANFEVGTPVGYASPIKKTPKIKKQKKREGFWSRLFHRKKKVVSLPSNTSTATSYSLPSPWSITEEPTPTAQERLLMNFIRKTNPKWDAFNSHALAYWLITVGQNFEVDPRVLASLIAVESSFRYDAVSTSNAKGFGQLKDDTANWLGVTDSFDPLQNLQGTAKYLQYLGQRFPDDAGKAIGSYYVGQGTVERQGMTEAAWYYVSKVQRYLDELLQQSANSQP